MRCVIYQGGAEVKNSVPLFVFPTKAPGGGMSPARPSGLRWKLNLRGRRQMKKKLFSLVLALALCMGLTVPVSAESAASVAWLDEGFDVGDYTVRENLLPVRDANWKYGFVDTTGKLAIPLKFDDAGEFSEGLARVQDRSDEFLWGYTDKTGKLVIPYRYTFARLFRGLGSGSRICRSGKRYAKSQVGIYRQNRKNYYSASI